VLQALSALPGEHRAVIIETYYHGLSVPMAAEILGVPEDAVKLRCYDALRALQRTLAERGLKCER
jgi:RNA polymerase sigma-70 factor, ECF subfamily